MDHGVHQTVEWFSRDGYLPHGHCYLWTPELLWTYVISDSVIALSYFSIPFALMYFVSRRKDLQFNWIFKLFSVFILACGVTHLLGVWTIWNPDYWMDAAAKSVTAGASLVSAIMLWRLIPRALLLPSTEQLRDANALLQKVIMEREAAVLEMEQAKLQAENATRMKSEFLANMSHELRTPLNAILGFSSLMGKDPTLSPGQHENIDIINRSGDHLLILINDVLDMAKIEAGRVQLVITRRASR
jgi:signal transduction histidine kinase